MRFSALAVIAVATVGGCRNEFESYCPEQHNLQVVELLGHFEEIPFSPPVDVPGIDPIYGTFGTSVVTPIDADLDGRAETLSVSVQRDSVATTSRYDFVGRTLVPRESSSPFGHIEASADIDRDGLSDEVSLSGIRWGNPSPSKDAPAEYATWPRNVQAPVHVSTDTVGEVIVLATLPQSAVSDRKPFARFRLSGRVVIDETQDLPNTDPIYVQSFSSSPDVIVAAGWSWLGRKRLPILFTKQGGVWQITPDDVPYGAPMGGLIEDGLITITYEPQIVQFDTRKAVAERTPLPFAALCLPQSSEPAIPWGITSFQAGDTTITCIAFGFDSPDKKVASSSVRCFTDWGRSSASEVGPKTMGPLRTNLGDYRFFRSFETSSGDRALSVSSVACSPHVYVFVND